ncbi:glycosyl hydrolase family 28 protein, partial [Salmonella enterica]|nr:glycosyl hydrolase family 28 protein [Salmonella enterica]
MRKTFIALLCVMAAATPSAAKDYVVTDYGVRPDDSTLLQTDKLQAVIDLAAKEGGGVVAIPRGTYLSGALFFHQGTHLRIEYGGTLKGIDDIAHYPIRKTRIEGRTLQYFSALVNADGLDGFSISGSGTIDGNGLRFWREFWLRRQVDKNCTNIEALRPRLIYISNCTDVSISGVTMQNSPFWTLHIYRSERVRITGTTTFSPAAPVKAPSTDAIDLDNCRDVIIRGCRISVNDDAIALKGGKGTWADTDPDNGPNEDVMIEDCDFGFVHSCLTLGSESIRNKNIVMRNCRVDGANRVIWLKFRPDTPQLYEDIRVEGVTGRSREFIVVRPWTQFYDKGER